MKLLERYKIIIHILGWTIFIFAPSLFSPVTYSSKIFNRFTLNQIIESIPIICFFYFNLFYSTANLLNKKNYFTYIIWALFWLVISVIISVISFKYQFRDISDLPEIPQISNLPMPSNDPFIGHKTLGQFLPLPILFHFFRMFVLFIFILLLSSFIAVWEDRVKTKELQQQLAVDKIASELAILKLQISPHFLFNTLNNIRWLARKKADTTEDAIIKLSSLLRYVLYQSNSEKVPLAQEVNHLADYIELQTMRLTERTKVVFKYEGDFGKYAIAPLIFIHFVENAFKFGVHGYLPSHVFIQFILEGETILFRTENSYFEENDLTETETKEEQSSGIGIQNVERRLKMLYPNTHTLKINSQHNLYVVNLTINLSDDKN